MAEVEVEVDADMVEEEEEEEEKEERGGGGRGGGGRASLRRRRTALIKSNNPHLAGGEKTYIGNVIIPTDELIFFRGVV